MAEDVDRTEFCSRLVEQYSANTRRMVERRMQDNRSDCDDIVQEILMSLYVSCINGAISNAEAFVSKLAKDKLIDHWRRLHRTRRRFEQVEAFMMEESAAVYLESDQELLKEIQQRFSASDANILAQLFAGSTQQEIAKELGCHPGTLSRKMERIADRIKREGLFGLERSNGGSCNE